MLSLSKRLFSSIASKFISNKEADNDRDDLLTYNFSKTKNNPFSYIQDTQAIDVFISKNKLTIGLKKPDCVSWAEIPEKEYVDHIIEAKFRLDCFGGYGACGLMYHIMDKNSYFIALVSNKGFFRVDLMKDGAVRPLIAWTEVPDFNINSVKLQIITFGTYQVFILNDKWAAEVSDDSIIGGRIGFATASYEDGESRSKYACASMIDYFTLETNPEKIENIFEKWNKGGNIDAEKHLLLAETFAVMGEAEKALDQLTKAWERRDEVISAEALSYTEVRTKKELLLAGRMSFMLGLYNEAEKYIDKIFELGINKEALTEKIKILNELEKYSELKELYLKYGNIIHKDIDLYTILGRCYWELEEYEDSAFFWDKAFEADNENGVYAANAANILEMTGKKDEALERYLKAGVLFLRNDNKSELAVIIPKLLMLGENKYEARVLCGKWFYSIEDYARCDNEFAAAEKLRRGMEPKPKPDPAVCYLWGLVFNINGKQKKAITLLKRAVRYAPDYGLFRFKLAELKLAEGEDTALIAKEFKRALSNMEDESGEMASYAANLLSRHGDEDSASYFTAPN